MKARTWTLFLVVGFTAGAIAAILGPTAQSIVALPIGIAAACCIIKALQ